LYVECGDSFFLKGADSLDKAQRKAGFKFDANFRALLESIPLFALLLDQDLQLIYMNKAGLDRNRVKSLDQFIRLHGASILDNLASPGREGVIAATQKVLDRTIPFVNETYFLRIEGVDELPMQVHVAPLKNPDDEIVGLVLIGRDATSNLHDHTEMLSGQSLIASILATVPDALVVIDEHGIITRFSHAACQLFGYSERETVGRNVSMLMPSPHQEKHDGYLARYLATGEKRIIGTGRQVEGRKRDGTLFPMELYIGEAISDGQRIFAGFIRDLSERVEAESRQQELEAELAHASRLSEMGTLASSLAHELNQPLTAIANYMATGKDIVSTLPDAQRDLIEEALGEAAQEALRAGQIVRRLRDYVAKRDTEREVVSVGKLLSDATTLGLVGAREKGISWAIDIDQTDDVIADRIQIQQVLVNLMRNAIEAMEGCDTKILTIRARNISDRKVQIAVIDTGPGLSPEVTAQLFQPFVTTKASGMGLGLSICRSIVEAHGGQIVVAPNPGGGTIFSFTLNRASTEEPDEQ
jgi:two-component system, LuxR family, sensor kinase FixL